MGYLTKQEACDRLRLSKRKLEQLVAQGDVTAWRAGDAPNSPIRIDEQSVDDYIAARMIRPAEPEPVAS